MLNQFIFTKAREWIESPECHVKETIGYIRARGFLREPQIQAIEVYLFLKLAGENRPLSELLADGFFNSEIDIERLDLSADGRELLANDTSAMAIFQLVRTQSGNTTSVLTDAERKILSAGGEVDYRSVCKKLFYDVEYADYLFSLPMGAGKTFVMAAAIYLDLYFAENEPDNKLFAHNFLVLIPSGLKSSIVPSLRSIEKFDPTWVIPEPSASRLRRHIKFEVLDEAKSAKKSNKAKNPNVQKVARHQPFEDLTGLVMVVNAEKVILDRLELSKTGELFEKTDDEKDAQANELREIIRKIPNLQIHIDEVHHATDSDIKLRQVVNKWNARGNVNSVLGYSGTPYLDKKEKFLFGDTLSFISEQITNTVYYYPLIEGIKTFLKKPLIKSEQQGLSATQIVKKGVEEFREKYGSLVYENGSIAKLAIYCGTIERLEEEIYPLLTGEMGIDKDSILKFHKGNKEHPQPTDSELEFRILDEPSSVKQIILLVQIGKEGWDCRSLTGVILSQSGDCPKNMVLQTSCRCLRQVDRGKNETALIWLSSDNAATLNKQLAEKQKTSIAEINKAGRNETVEMLKRYSRLDHLKLPKIDFYQFRVEYQTLVAETRLDSKKHLDDFDQQSYFTPAIVQRQNLGEHDDVTTVVLDHLAGDSADFNQWLFQISKESFNLITEKQLREFESELRGIFTKIISDDGKTFNALYDQDEVRAGIRLAFHAHREIKIKSEVIPDEARMLIVEKLQDIPKPRNYHPEPKEVADILEIDSEGLNVDEKIRKRREEYDKAAEQLKSMGMDPAMLNMPNGYPEAVTKKDRTFHFLPYRFDSGFEKSFLIEALRLETLAEKGLEVYFNGEKDITDFRIACYTENNKPVGRYTPDFLIIKRKRQSIHKILILETKGSGYADQKEFVLRRTFVENQFLKFNNKNFGYDKFDYLFLTDADDMTANLTKLDSKVKAFFAE